MIPTNQSTVFDGSGPMRVLHPDLEEDSGEEEVEEVKEVKEVDTHAVTGRLPGRN